MRTEAASSVSANTESRAVLGGVHVNQTLHETERILAFAYLLTVLLFARSGLYSDRAQRPGLSRIVASLFRWPSSR